MVLVAGTLQRSYPYLDVVVSPRIANADRFIEFPDGGQFQCADIVELDQLTQEKTEAIAAWLESKVIFATIGIALLVSSLFAGYFWGLPALAERAAQHIAIETESILGEQATARLEETGVLNPTTLDNKTQNIIQHEFNNLLKGLPLESHYRLEFRDSPTFGANAFAMPGGTIIITDAMVALAQTPEELAAILAHEIGHIEHRHPIKLIVQDSIAAVVAAVIIGDISSLGVADLATVLAQARYSREFESDADEFAFALLKSRGRSPNSFADIMIRLYDKEKKGGAEKQADFLSTHPLTLERIKRAREVAAQE